MRNRKFFLSVIMVMTMLLALFGNVSAAGKSVSDAGSGYSDGSYSFSFTLSGCSDCTSVTVEIDLDEGVLTGSASGSNCDSASCSGDDCIYVTITSAKNPGAINGSSTVTVTAGASGSTGYSFSIAGYDVASEDTPTPTPTNTSTPTPTPTTKVTATPTPTKAPTATPTPVPTEVPVTEENTEDTPTPTPTSTPTPTPTGSTTPTPTPTGSVTPTGTPTPTPTKKPLGDGETDRSNTETTEETVETDETEETYFEGEVPTKAATKIVQQTETNKKEISVGYVVWNIVKFVAIILVVLIIVRLVLLKIKGVYNEDLLKEFIPQAIRPDFLSDKPVEEEKPIESHTGFLQKSNTESVRPVYSNTFKAAPRPEVPLKEGEEVKEASIVKQRPQNKKQAKKNKPKKENKPVDLNEHSLDELDDPDN